MEREWTSWAAKEEEAIQDKHRKILADISCEKYMKRATGSGGAGKSLAFAHQSIQETADVFKIAKVVIFFLCIYLI